MYTRLLATGSKVHPIGDESIIILACIIESEERNTGPASELAIIESVVRRGFFLQRFLYLLQHLRALFYFAVALSSNTISHSLSG